MRELTWISMKESALLILLAERRQGKKFGSWCKASGLRSRGVVCLICGDVFENKGETCLMTDLDRNTTQASLASVGAIEHARKHLEESKLLGWM